MNWRFIVPYRNNAHLGVGVKQTTHEQNLKRFVKHYSHLFPGVPIFVIEQTAKPDPDTTDKLQGFNRGKLFNIGYINYCKDVTYFCMSDCDMYLMTHKGEGKAGYDYPENPTHIATRCEQFGFTMPYKDYCGGIALFTPKQYEHFQGFPNWMFGYGNEDDSLYWSIIDSGLTLDRRECYFNCAKHKRTLTPALFRASAEYRRQGRSPEDNLSNCHYTIIEETQEDGYTRLLVDL